MPAATVIDDQQLLATKPDVNYKELSAQPSPQDFLVLTRVKGVVSVAQLCNASGLGREKTLAAIEVLLDVGLLHVVDADGNPIPTARPKKKPPVVAAKETLAPDDQTVVVSAAEAAAAVTERHGSGSFGRDEGIELVEDEDEGLELDLYMGPPANSLSDEEYSEVIAVAPAPQAEVPVEFEVDHQPVAAATEEYIVPTRVADDHAIEVYDEPVSSIPVQHTSFETISRRGDDDDDLFESASPAHIARIEGRAPIKRERENVRVTAARAAVEQATKAPPRESNVDASRFARFPVDFASYVSKHPRIGSLDEMAQKEIDFVFDHLEYVDFYQLFNVPADADRKQIRAAYFDMSKRFHPDKFFRDEVGELSQRVDAIFRFVTKGYQALSKNDKRAEYDEALARARAQTQQASAEEERKRALAADMLERRATQLEQQGQFAQAAAELKKVGTLRRDSHAFVRAASLFLRANQQLDEAASLARAAVLELPGEVEPRLVLGQIYEKNGMLADAARAFGEAAELAPNDPSVRVHLERVRSQS